MTRRPIAPAPYSPPNHPDARPCSSPSCCPEVESLGSLGLTLAAA